MTVSELIDALQTMPCDAEVILQGDPEGNYYHKLRGVDGDAIYQQDSGNVVSTDWTWKEACFPSSEDWEIFKKARSRCVVLDPE